MSAVTIRNVAKLYDGVPVLRDINIAVDAGEFCTVVGASGCGKSTFLRMLLSEERPSSGEIRIDGEPVAPEPGPDRGVVYQRYSVFPHLTVLQNVMLGPGFLRAPFMARLFGAKARALRKEAMQYLDAVGLAAVCDQYPAALSGGMQQRLAIAQALIMRPKLLLLDEPFGALDPGTRKDMHELLRRLWRDSGMTVFMVTHDLQEGFSLGTRVLVFDKPPLSDASAARGATITYDLQLKRRPSADAIWGPAHFKEIQENVQG